MLEPVISDARTDARFQRAVVTAAVYESGAGRLLLTGADARDLLNRLSTNLVDPDAAPGSVCATVLTSDRGRIVDLVYVIHCGDHQLLLTSPGRQEAVAAFLDQYTIMEELEVADITGSTAMLTLAGPTAAAVLRPALRDSTGKLPTPPSAILDDELAGTARYVGIGEPGSGERMWECLLTVLPNNPAAELPIPAYHLLLLGLDADRAAAAAERCQTHLMLAGALQLSAAAAETLRIVHRHPRYGAEMSDAYNPLEAGLIGAIDFHKGCYIGQEVIARLDTYQKVQKYLVALRFETADGAAGATAIPAAGARLVDEAGKATGLVTSATALPSGAGADADNGADAGDAPAVIGLGYVRTAAAQVGNRLQVVPLADDGSISDDGRIRPTVTAEITALPQLFGGEQPAPTR